MPSIKNSNINPNCIELNESILADIKEAQEAVFSELQSNALGFYALYEIIPAVKNSLQDDEDTEQEEEDAEATLEVFLEKLTYHYSAFGYYTEGQIMESIQATIVCGGLEFLDNTPGYSEPVNSLSGEF